MPSARWCAALVRLAAGAVCAAVVFVASATIDAGGEAWPAVSLGGLDAKVFALGAGAASCAVHEGLVSALSTLTIIDYSKPSTDNRLWVFDVRAHTLLYESLVAHGRGSGDNLATVFSNDAETHRSSLGLFVAGDTYTGKNGYSLRLDGLDRGFNDHAR